MIILKGAEVSARIKDEVSRTAKELGGAVPRLAIVRVGEKPDDISYEKGAKKKMENFGLAWESFVVPGDISHEEFRKEFQKINENSQIDGILLLRPLPRQINEKEIERLIDPAKDLDGISPENIAKVFAERLSELKTQGFAHIREIWLNNAKNLGGKITVNMEHESKEGQFLGIDENGALLLERDGKTEKIYNT